MSLSVVEVCAVLSVCFSALEFLLHLYQQFHHRNDKNEDEKKYPPGRDPCGYLTNKPKRETNRKKHQPPFAVLSIAQKRPPVKASASFLPNDDVVFSLKTVPGWAS